MNLTLDCFADLSLEIDGRRDGHAEQEVAIRLGVDDHYTQILTSAGPSALETLEQAHKDLGRAIDQLKRLQG